MSVHHHWQKQGNFPTTRALFAALLTLAAAGCASSPPAEPEPAPGSLAYDQRVFHALLDHHEAVRRTVTVLPDGVEAVTESDDPAVAALLKDHVMAMKTRIESGRRVRAWDPLYAAIFDHRDKIHFEVTAIEKGVRIRETSDDPYVIGLIHQHAKTVTGFVEIGHEESAREHPVPPREAAPTPP